ncbi:hypothetical protein BC567DRAFT_37374 [Phyllosticta citribraziliensis]
MTRLQRRPFPRQKLALPSRRHVALVVTNRPLFAVRSPQCRFDGRGNEQGGELMRMAPSRRKRAGVKSDRLSIDQMNRERQIAMNLNGRVLEMDRPRAPPICPASKTAHTLNCAQTSRQYSPQETAASTTVVRQRAILNLILILQTYTATTVSSNISNSKGP